MKGERRDARYLFSFLVWVAWIILFCAIVLTFEAATGYLTLTGATSNRAFIAFVLIIMAAVSLARPEVPFLLAVFFMPLSQMAFPGIAFIQGHLANMEIVHPMIFGAIIGCVFKSLRRGEPILESSPILVPLFFFLAWSALSLTWCIDPAVGKWELLDIFFALVVYVASLMVVRSHAVFDRVVKVWILSGVLLTGLGLRFIMTGAAARVEVMTGHPNVFSAELNLVIMFVIAMLYLRESRFLPGWILWPLLIIMLFVNLRTGSRAGFFSLLAALLFFLFSYHSLRKDKRHISLLLFFVVVLLAGAVLLVAFDPLKGFMIGFRGYNPVDFPEDVTFQFRLHVWNLAWDDIRSSGQYIQGLGILSFPSLHKELKGIGIHPHSIYFNIGFHYGLVGLAIFIWIILVLIQQFRSGLRATHEKYYQVLLRAMAAGLLAFAIHGIVDFNITQHRSVWLYAGVAMSAVILARKERRLPGKGKVRNYMKSRSGG